MSDKMYHHSCFLLNRLDEQFNKVSIKVNLYLLVNTILITATGFFIERSISNTYITNMPSLLIVFKVLFIAIILLSTASIILLILISSPYLPKAATPIGYKPTDSIAKLASEISIGIWENKSLIYFKSIAEQDNSFFEKYCKIFNQKGFFSYPDYVKADLLSQVYILAKGLTRKNRYLKIVSILMIVTILILAGAVILAILFAK